jgi:energy-coupling factor transporter transmembrane protein EcfT
MENARVRSNTGAGEWSIYGALFFLVTSIAASIVLQGVWAVLGLVYVAAWASLMSPEAVHSLKKRRFWFFLVSITVISLLAMGGEETVAVAGLNLSRVGLSAGFGMALRATTIILATAAFARTASIGRLAALFARRGVGETGLLLGIAVNQVPLIQRTAASALLARRLRGGVRRKRLESLKRLVVTILVNALRHSEDIVCAAEARAFGGSQPAVCPICVTRGDRLLGAASAAFYGAIVLAHVVGHFWI